jgi:hypothetical protein
MGDLEMQPKISMSICLATLALAGLLLTAVPAAAVRQGDVIPTIKMKGGEEIPTIKRAYAHKCWAAGGKLYMAQSRNKLRMSCR